MDESKDKKSFKKLIFIWIVLTIPIILIFILSLVDYLKLPVTYDDVIYQEVTFSHYTESNDSENTGTTFRIFVDELDKPLYINNLITSKNLILKVYDFKKGEKFYCYYMEEKYEVVEMGTNIPFITKFANSPTKPVDVIVQCIIFLINSIRTPATGPSESVPIIAGKSENSISKNPAIFSPITLPRNCSMHAAAASTPIFVI